MAAPTDDRHRSIYLGACRVDLVRRAGPARLLTDARLARAVVRALEAADAPVPASVTVVLTDDDELRDLNRVHLERDEPTDVLSFPMLPAEAYPPHAGRPGSPRSRSRGAVAAGHAPVAASRTHVGDIAISVPRAIEQAEAGRGGQTGDVRWSAADEIRLLVTHGALHLCGWDHAEPAEEAAMRALEQRLLAEDRR
ncbi:MAG TPA: rRNA maturation RNase YbeY [Candidatus Limnocylindrales bacterium]|nr:rRNA maturation RNase YbeY [Candidatus Limnocylindrales bacterium]